MLTKAPKGTKDILPGSSEKWQYVEDTFREICRRYGMEEVRTPTFEHTELFKRGVGDTTDIVQKEIVACATGWQAGLCAARLAQEAGKTAGSVMSGVRI